MEKYELKANDYKDIEELVATTKSIDILYGKLCELECNDAKNSEEYEKYFDYLTIALEVEQEKYLKISVNFEKLIAVMQYLNNLMVPNNDLLSDTESIMQHQFGNRQIRRITNTLINRLFPTLIELKELLPDEVVEVMNDLELDIDRLTREGFQTSKEISNAFDGDLSMMYLSVLDSYINNEKYVKFKNKLIEAKYNVSFIDAEVENNMIANHFNVSKNLHLNSGLVALSLGMDQEMYDFLRGIISTQKAHEQMEEILKNHDSDYDDDDKYLTILSRQVLLRTAFLYMNEDLLADLNYEFHEYIEQPEYIRDYKYDSKSEEIIINSFKCIKADGTKYNVMILRKRPEV